MLRGQLRAWKCALANGTGLGHVRDGFDFTYSNYVALYWWQWQFLDWIGPTRVYFLPTQRNAELMELY